MTNVESRLQRRLRFAGVLIMAGLIVEMLTLHWANPISFLLFITAAGLLTVVGLALFLKAVVSG